jgi:hypothetical protein
MSNFARWRGLSALIGDAVEQGTTAVERIHMATAGRPFKIIEQIPPIAGPTKLVHGVHDAIVTNTYSQIRWWNSTVQKVVQAALKDDPPPPQAAAAPEPSSTPEIPGKS